MRSLFLQRMSVFLVAVALAIAAAGGLFASADAVLAAPAPGNNPGLATPAEHPGPGPATQTAAAAAEPVLPPNNDNTDPSANNDQQSDNGDQSGQPDKKPLEKASSLIESFQFPLLWQNNSIERWLTLLGAIFVGLVIGKICQYFLNKLGQRLIDRQWPVRGHVFADLASPLSLAIFTIGLTFGLSQLKMAPALSDFCIQVEKLLISIAVFWYLYNLVSVIEVGLSRLTAKTESTLDDMLVPLIRKTLRIFLVVIGTLFILDSVFKVDIGAWLAGLGIAGLAVSLAAQDSLKNLFGSITIFLDRPFLVGSFIKYQGDYGTIEEIGFRSTKMRTLYGALVTIPNSTIVNEAVENVGARPFIRRDLNVTITYDTPAEKIEEAVNIIKEIFELDGIREAIHDASDPDNLPPRVYFNDYNAASLNIVVIYWHRPPDFWKYYEHCDRFNMELFKRYNEAGIDFAFPTQTLYLAGDEKRPLTIGTKALPDENKQ